MLDIGDVAVGRNQWYHFGAGAPPILVYFSWDWDVHWGYRVLTHGHVSASTESVAMSFGGFSFFSASDSHFPDLMISTPPAQVHPLRTVRDMPAN